MWETLRSGNRQLKASARIQVEFVRIYMNDQGAPPPERLDSWKAIADYLDRDVATVRRWERLHRLPIRRIAGRGRSVFAYVSEIDEWLRAMPAAGVVTVSPTPPAIPPPVLETQSSWRWPVVAAAVIVVSGLLWSIPLLTSAPIPFRAEMRSTGIVAMDKSGREQWVYAFPRGDRSVPKAPHSDVVVMAGANPGVLAATSYYEQAVDGNYRSGQLLWLTPAGALSRTFSFNDRLVVGGQTYEAPWTLADFSVNEGTGSRLIAISALHKHWWPSLVTVLDEQWRRKGTFANSGWVTELNWLSPDRLLISGFSNDHDGGMVAILDAGALEGQSPASGNPMYVCSTCPNGSPLRYVVMPRSEVNQASGATLNGAIVQIQDGQILVHTLEVSRTADAVEALYEFSPSLELVRASYGDRYWEAHRTLEAEGKINHSRERCPYREGPQGIKVWDKASGWTPLDTK
jgi:hypothetical protein